MDSFFQNVLTASFHGSIVILAVLVLRVALRKAPKKFICWLWTLAGLRLLMPIPLHSSFSLQPPTITIPASVNLSAAVPVVWGGVALVIGLYSLVSYFRLRRQVLDAVKVPGGWESDRIETAFVLGFVRPKIYIPAGMPQEARKQILAHERTHLDKGDHWIKMVGFLALALHWFNPLVWVSYVLLCKDIEMACDERVVQFMELDERKAYSSALLQCSTNRAHYAACPVAFGEISVKYRIKSVLNYRKPSFWLSLLCLLAIVFVAVCLMTSPETVVEVPVDPDAALQEISREDPANFTPAQLPEVEPHPDWGLEIAMDAASPTGGTIIYRAEERFAAASEDVNMKSSTIDRWNGEGWEPMPSLSGQTKLFEDYGIGFAGSRRYDVSYFPMELDWTLYYGALPAGDYRISQTIESQLGTAVFQTAFHIYREELPSQEEAALSRCATALDTLMSDAYAITLSETDLDGNVSPTQKISKGPISYRIEHILGEFTTSVAVTKEFYTEWDVPFRLNQNRRFLFPEGQSRISQEEITFCSVWADWQGVSYRGTDTFRFYEDGRLKSIDRLVQTLDAGGAVAQETAIRLESEAWGTFSTYWNDVETYELKDDSDAANDSPWGIFFRIDDDYLNPAGGEVWLACDAVGVSNYTTDGSYWLEKKVNPDLSAPEWQRLGGDTKQASWGDETIPLVSQTAIRNIDWTADYGRLDSGVYRMGKHFYSGDESTIQYAEFAIYETGGIYGQGAEEALARADAAMEQLQKGNYRVEKYTPTFVRYGEAPSLSQVIWRYNDTVVYDFYNDAGQYSHSAPDYPKDPSDEFHMNWWERSGYDSPYSSLYFGKGRSIISDREIRFVQTWGRNSADNPNTIYTYRFNESGELTEFLIEYAWDSYTRYVVTDTPESEIQAWVEAKQAEYA